MKIGSALSHFQILSKIPQDDIWIHYNRYPIPNKGIQDLKNKNLDKLIEVLTLEGELKYVRFSLLSSYIIKNGEIDKEKMKEYINFLNKLRDYDVNILLVLIHYTYPYYFGDIFSKNFSKSFIDFFEKIKEIINYADSITPINEPSLWMIKRLDIKDIPKIFRGIKNGIENIKEIHNYIWDEYKKEKRIVNNNYSFWFGDIFYLLNIFNLFRELDFLPSHVFGLNYYGELKIFGKGYNFYGNKFSPFRLYVNDLPKIINYYRKRGKEVIITETGMHAGNRKEENIRYNYISELLNVLNKLDVKEVYIWSTIDNFEWEKGYKKKFGICYDIDFNRKEICDKYIELFNKYK